MSVSGIQTFHISTFWNVEIPVTETATENFAEDAEATSETISNSETSCTTRVGTVEKFPGKNLIAISIAYEVKKVSRHWIDTVMDGEG